MRNLSQYPITEEEAVTVLRQIASDIAEEEIICGDMRLLVLDAAISAIKIAFALRNIKKNQEDMAITTAPWNQEEIDFLNAWQKDSRIHPFNCVHEHEGKRMMTATKNGWKCQTCGYMQNWAHKFMLKNITERD